MRVRLDFDTARLREEADAKLAAAQKEHAKALEFIEQAERYARNGHAPAAKPARANSPKSNGRVPHGGLRATLYPRVLELLGRHQDGCTLATIADAVGAELTRTQIGRALYKMHTGKQIRIVRKQSGTVPALYALPKKEL
ncbi:MAG TPA: hypothetical protein VH518_07550 [Tepidisphaeraceae bacterium]|jgi:hypothetical protein